MKESKDSMVILKLENVVLRGKKVKNGYSLFLDIHSGGRRFKEYLNIHISGNAKPSFHDQENIRLAKAVQSRRYRELKADDNNEPNFKPKNQNFKAFFEDYLNKNPQLRPNTLKIKRSFRLLLEDYHPGNLIFKHINKPWLEGFRNFLLSKYKRNTADRYFSELKTIFNKAVEEEVIIFNPMSTIKAIGKDRALPKFLTLEEVKLLWMTPMENDNVKRAFLFACFTGLRGIDVRNLKWENLFLVGEHWYINYEQIKTSSRENSPISTQAMKFINIDGKHNHNDFIFDLPIKSVVDKSLKRWAKRAKLGKSISFHIGRHTFATLSLSYGNDLYTTSKLLGHADIRTTEIYARVIDKQKEMAVLRMPELG